MDIYKETSETWNKIASLYEEKFMYLDLYDETYEFICKAIGNNKAKLLDIGCGPGNITKYLLTKRPDFRIEGIDIAPNMVALAKKNNPNASFKVMDTRNINKLDTRYDGIICGFCLPYLSEADCSKFIDDASNLLLEGGLLYLSFVEGEPSESAYKTGAGGNRVYFFYHNLDHLIKLLGDNGFEEPVIFKVDYEKGDNQNDEHTILIVKKAKSRK